MAKYKRNKAKETKSERKRRKSYADSKQMNFTPEVKTAFWTALVVLLVLGIFYLISIKASGGSFFKSKEKKDVEIQYTEILAGTSFDMGENYYVLYYDFENIDDEENSQLDEAKHNFESQSHETPLYTCDLNNSFNKPFVTTNEPNTNPYSAEDLLINGTTLIHFVNGQVENYIYGFNDVKTFLDSYQR